jgi:F420-dependent oxidoreductase-like protein
MAAQTIDALSGSGRMILGIGVSGPQIVEGWYGQPWGKPAERLRDYVAIIKKVLKRDAPVTHAGSEISLPYTGPGSSGIAKPLKSILHGNPDIPIVLGTVTPGNVRLTAEIAEGWLVMHFVPGLMQEYRPLIEAGLKKRTDGLTLDRFDMTGMVAVHVDQDVKKAIDAEKPELALYVGGMGAKGKNFHKERMVERGYGAAADRIQELYLAGRKDEAIAAVPDDYIDEGALIGPPERIRQRWPAWRDSGLTRLAIHHPTDEAVEVMAKVAL